MSFEDRCIAMIKEGEGSIPHMYLDTKGYVTVAVGQLLKTVAAATALNFVHADNGGPASGAEIEADFNSVSSQEYGNYSASYYRQFTVLLLPEDAINTLVKKRIDEFVTQLKVDFPRYDTYAENAKLGLIDMAFNLGNWGLVNKFPSFTRAARNEDWATCAIECHRRDIGEHRNEVTRALFEEI